MSEEIEDKTDAQSDEKPEELMQKVSLNDDEENEPPLSTPNGRETPSTVSYSDSITRKDVEILIAPETRSTVDDTEQLLEIIADKSNKDASTTILNRVKQNYYHFLFTFYFHLFSWLKVISISIKIISFKSQKIFQHYFLFLINYHHYYKLKFLVY